MIGVDAMCSRVRFIFVFVEPGFLSVCLTHYHLNPTSDTSTSLISPTSLILSHLSHRRLIPALSLNIPTGLAGIHRDLYSNCLPGGEDREALGASGQLPFRSSASVFDIRFACSLASLLRLQSYIL